MYPCYRSGDLKMVGSSNSGSVIELMGKGMVFAIILVLFVAVSVICIHLYAKRFFLRENNRAATTRRRRRQQGRTIVSALPHGLDPSVLKTIPVVIFDPKEFKDGLACAVCLSDVSEGEKARFLPSCSHGFHGQCIDIWFQSHSTCPLCRNPVAGEDELHSAAETPLEAMLQVPNGEHSGANIVPTEAPSLPTNVLLWGDETRVNTSGPWVEKYQLNRVGEPCGLSSSSSSSKASTSNRPGGMLVIDIPRQISEGEEQKAPFSTRLGKLKRLLSGNRRVNYLSSPRNLDVKQGGRFQN